MNTEVDNSSRDLLVYQIYSNNVTPATALIVNIPDFFYITQELKGSI